MDEIADEFDRLRFHEQAGFGGKTRTRTAASLNLKARKFHKAAERGKI